MNLNIRDFPEKLAQELRVEAARKGVSLREYVIARLEYGDAVEGVLSESSKGLPRRMVKANQVTDGLVRKSDTQPAKGDPTVKHYDLGVGSGSQSGSGVRVGAEKSAPASKKMSTDEYLGLSNSEKLRAQREGRY